MQGLGWARAAHARGESWARRKLEARHAATQTESPAQDAESNTRTKASWTASNCGGWVWTC
eukprot:6461617-Amphidinium_carterae.1